MSLTNFTLERSIVAACIVVAVVVAVAQLGDAARDRVQLAALASSEQISLTPSLRYLQVRTNHRPIRGSCENLLASC